MTRITDRVDGNLDGLEEDDVGSKNEWFGECHGLVWFGS